MFKTRLTTRIIESRDTRRLRLTRKTTGRVVEKRLGEHLAELVPDWSPRVTRDRGRISVEMTIPAGSEAEAEAKMLYWVRRVVGRANLVFNEREIVKLSAVADGR